MQLAGMVVLGMALAGTAAAQPSVERGRYLVEQVGMCADCHTPRDAQGAVVAGAALGGAPIGIAPVVPVPGWAGFAPRLAGLPARYTEAALAMFLQTGVRPDGSRAAPPMPSFRLAREDAEAVAAYLHSLPGEAQGGK